HAIGADAAAGGEDFDRLAGEGDLPRGRALEQQRPASHGRRREALAGAIWIDGRSVSAKTRGAVERDLTPDRARVQKRRVDAVRPARLVLSLEARHLLGRDGDIDGGPRLEMAFH